MSEWNLAVLNLHVSPMPSTKFQLNPTYRSRADVISRFSNWSPCRPSWTLEWNQFSNSKSPCHPNTSPKVWVQSDLPFGSRHGSKIFKMATLEAILDIKQNDFSNSESEVWAQSDLGFGSRCGFKIFKTVWIAKRNNFLFFFIWVYSPFKNISLIWGRSFIKGGRKPENLGKTTWPCVRGAWLSHMWPERGSNHSSEKPNGLKVNSPIH